MKEKPRIVLIGPLPPPYHGVTISTQRLLNSELMDHLRIVHVDTSDHRTVSNIGALDIQNFALAFKSYLQLIKICLETRPDLVYIPISQTFIGFFRDAFYITFPKIFFGSKVVIHLRGGYFRSFYDRSGLLTRKGIDFVMRFVDRVIVLGDVLKPIFRKWFDSTRIDVVPNGTDLIIEGVDEKLRSEEPARAFTYMSSLMRTKGIVEFVEAACRVLEHHNDVVFHVAGEWWNQEPNLRPGVEAIVNACASKDRIVFHGLVTGEAKKRLLFETDVFVLPTYYQFEGHPNAIVEAMAAGCAVISTAHAAIPETVIHGKTGLIIEKQDLNSLRESMETLLNDSKTFKQMAINSYNRYLSEYTSQKNIKRIKYAYYKTLMIR